MVTNAYQRVQNQTASKERIMVLLFQAAHRHMVSAMQHLEQKQTPEALKVLGKASDIVMELWSTIDHSKAPELGKQLESIYQYVSVELTKATGNKKPEHARNAARAFYPLVEAFSQAVEKVGARP